MSRIITVFGATGNQGGSVIKTILASTFLSSTYKIRAVTRDPTKDSAKLLASHGCELVKADLNDADSVKAAVQGSFAVFGITNFWEIFSKEVEIKQGKAIANACKAAGVKHLVWSSLPHATKLTNGTLKNIDHFDSKAEVEEYIEKIKGDMLATHFMPAGFMTNFKTSIKKGPDGVPTLFMPIDATKTQFPLIDVVNDTGKYVMGILAAGSAADGARVQAVSEWVVPEQITATLSEVTGKDVKFAQIPPEVFKSFLPPPIAEELTENMALIADYSYYGLGSEKKQAENDKYLLEGSKLTTWKEYVEANGPWEW